MIKGREWGTFRSLDFPTDDAARAIVILPIGSMEQHGPHLPVNVDTLLVTEIAKRAISETQHLSILLLPPLWVSLAEHHMSFAGTLTLDFPTFSVLLRCIVESLKRQGFQKILLLNGHGGNKAALTVIVGELTRELEVPVATATYWELAETEFRKILQGQTQLYHACEAETSMVMATAPHLVEKGHICWADTPANGFGEEAAFHRFRKMKHWSNNGVVGTPQFASAIQGERLLKAAATALATHLSRNSIWPELP